MRILLLATFVLATACLHAQNSGLALDYASSVWVDPSSGETNGQAFSEITGTQSLPIASMTASVSINMYDSSGYINTSGFETDNVAEGYASVVVYGQVYVLGDYIAESSAHDASAFVYEFTWSDQEYSSDYFQVPYGPTISLTGINAYEPHSVLWRYSVSGTCPYSLTLQLPPNVYSYSTSCPTGEFSSDQSWYEAGYNVASITGHMYGVTTAGTTCAVSLNTLQSFSGTSGGIPTPDVLTEKEGIIAVFSPTHIATDVVNWYQYCVNLDYGSLQTQLTLSGGSLSTVGTPPGLNTAIYDIGETHTITSGGSSQTGIVYGMGEPTSSNTFVPADTAHFDSKEINWNDWWLPAGSGISICNTAAWYEPEAYYPYNPSPNATNLFSGPPQGCWGTNLP